MQTVSIDDKKWATSIARYRLDTASITNDQLDQLIEHHVESMFNLTMDALEYSIVQAPLSLIGPDSTALSCMHRCHASILEVRVCENARIVFADPRSYASRAYPHLLSKQAFMPESYELVSGDVFVFPSYMQYHIDCLPHGSAELIEHHVTLKVR